MGMGLGGAGWVPPAWAVAAGAECPETEGHQLTLKCFGYFSSQMPVVKKNKEKKIIAPQLSKERSQDKGFEASSRGVPDSG